MSVLAFDSSADPILQRRRQIQEGAAASLRRRKLYSKAWVGLCWAFLVIAIIPLVAVVAYVVAKGLPAWSVDFFTHVTVPEGIPGGGVWNAIVGTAEIAAIATVVTVPLGLTIGLLLAESDGRVAAAVRFAADVMTGVPSITIGIIMLPVIIRAGETAFRSVPSDLAEAALALGARRSVIARRVVVPAALPGVITGVLLAVARGLGETAPLLLTIFGNQYMQWSPTKPMNALPLVIFNNSSQPYADLIQIAWGAALVLLVVVLVLSIGSRVAAAILQKERR
jgi:phosphate transport system permease protein